MFAWLRRGPRAPADVAAQAEAADRPERRPEAPPPRRGRVDYAALAAAAARTRPSGPSPFVPAEPPPGVLPAGAPAMAADAAVGLACDYAAAGAPFDGSGGAWDGQRFLGYPALSALSQLPEYRSIVETHAREMTRRWIKLRAAGDEDKGDKLDRLDAALDRLKLRDVFRRAAELDGFFGRAHLFPDFGDADPAELAAPLIRAPAKVARGSLRGFRVVEPTWTYPARYNSTDPLRSDFYRPTAWYVMGREVHASRLLTFIGREVPDLLKPAYAFGGLSMSQMAKPYVDNWLRTRQSVSDLVHSFSVNGLKTNLDATLSGSEAGIGVGGLGVLERVQMFNQFRDNRGTMVLDKETEEFFNVSTPLGTLDKLLAQSQEQMGSVSGTPLVWLLGLTPTGLNATTDGEERVFHSRIGAAQEHLFGHPLRAALELVQLSELGEIDPGITFGFEPLWQMDDAARATIRKTEADTDALYMQEGVVSPEEVRARLAREQDSPYPGLDLSVPAPGKPGDDETEMEALLRGAGEGDDPGEPGEEALAFAEDAGRR